MTPLADPSSPAVARMRPSMVPAVARLHRAAFAGYLNTRLGAPYLRAFFRWFCEAEEAIAFCALDGAMPVGYVVGAPLGYAGALNRRLLVPALSGIMLRPWLFFDPHFRRTLAHRWHSRRGQAPPDDAPDLPAPTLSLVGIAVAPAARGQRLGQRLMDAFEAEALRRGAHSLRLSVYPENTAARRLYERAGWRCHPRSQGRADYFYKILDENPVAASHPASSPVES